MANRLEPVLIEDARIVFRNFKGAEGMYNREGDRNFAVLLDEDVAQAMAADGWNVKWPKERPNAEEGDVRSPHLGVSVSFKGRPPQIVTITSRGRMNLDEDVVEMLDYADFKTVDVIIRPYEWDVNGNRGIKAYCQSLFATLEENYLDLKYANIPDARVGLSMED